MVPVLCFSQNGINPIVGDTSWYESKGEWPNGNESEIDRISVHLTYVLHRLKAVNNSNPKRKINLDHLEAYISRGEFPINEKYKGERWPCFIDDQGSICAVGYLVEQTASREFAEQINQKFQYDYLMNMEDENLLAWQAKSGLTFEELAMIQPTYNYKIIEPSPILSDALPIPIPKLIYTARHIELSAGYSFTDLYPLNTFDFSYIFQFDMPIRNRFSWGLSVLYEEKNQKIKNSEITLMKAGFIPTGYWYFKRGKRMEIATYVGFGIQTKNFEQKNRSNEIEPKNIGSIVHAMDGRLGMLCRYYPIRRLGITGAINYGGPLATLGLTYSY
jgi:hypothetical protein